MHLIFVLKLQLLIFSSLRVAEQQKLSLWCHCVLMLPEPQRGREPPGWAGLAGNPRGAVEEEYLFLPPVKSLLSLV